MLFQIKKAINNVSKELYPERIKRIIIFLLLFFGLFMFKRYFYNRLVPISQIMDEIKDQKYRKLLLGNMLIFGYYKVSALQKGSPSYVISSMNYYKPKRIIEAA